MNSNQSKKQPNTQELIQSLLGQATTQNIGKPGAYQQGVDKALKSMGEQHAAEAIQQGVSPQEITQLSKTRLPYIRFYL